MNKTLLALATLVLSAPMTLAHATFEQREVPQNTTQRMVLRVPHGCDGEATLRVRVAIPDGVVGVQPMPKGDWTLKTVKGPLAQPYTSHGRTITEGVREIVWEGNLAADHYDEFIFRARFTDALPKGETVWIPVVQECATKAERWIEVPAAGKGADDLRYPAPGVMVVPATGHH